MIKKVLLIEDDKPLRENTAELLELSNYKVLTAPDGEKGILIAKASHPDVIICDIMMPKLDGYGVLAALSEDNNTKSIPFIFLSAKTERKDIRLGMEMGADDYLTKPFEESELIGAIESRIAKSNILKEAQQERLYNNLASEARVKSIHQLKNFIDDNGEEFRFHLGDSIYREGDNSNLVYLVIEGNAKTHKLDEQGKELITGIYKADDFFGFTSFTKNIPYQEYATAMEDSILIGLHKDQLKMVLEQNSELVLELLQLLSENLSQIKEQLLQMAYGSVRKKTASTLLKFAEKLQEDEAGNIHVLRSDLASVAGMATETLIRTLSTFKKEGIIEIKDRDIKILDMDRLQRIPY
jgi:CRP-like cAMP-binding protein